MARKTYDCDTCGRRHPNDTVCRDDWDSLVAERDSLQRQLARAVKPKAPARFPNEHLIDRDNGNPVTLWVQKNNNMTVLQSDEMDQRFIEIEVTDEASHARVLNLVMSPVEFFRAFLQSDASVPASAVYYALDAIGTKYENEVSRVFTDLVEADCPPYKDREGRHKWALEVCMANGLVKNGWWPDTSDLFNHNKRSDIGGREAYNVIFRRRVDPTTGDPI